jgi:hypothetical protein
MRSSFVVLGWVLLLSLPAQAAHVPTCVEEADDHGPFSIFQAQRLCAGSFTTAPAFCGKLAAKYLTTEQAVSLCMYATSDAPVQCASAGDHLPLNSTQILYLCNQAQNVAPADCAFSALEMNIFTGDQVALLCFGSVDSTPVACASSTFLSTRSAAATLTACRAIQPQQPGLGGLPPFGPFPGGPFPGGPLPPLGPGGPLPPLPNPGPNPLPGGGGTGMFTSCLLTTAVGSYQGIGFTQGQATAAARDQCLQVESVLSCDAGRATCH